MAQEIQRKLEETEVKTRELETRGVAVEKALRGEDDGACSRDESELLQEWFDLMRDRTELRRYEKELMIRAQELELEDRHARLQHELRERLESSEFWFFSLFCRLEITLISFLRRVLGLGTLKLFTILKRFLNFCWVMVGLQKNLARIW